MKVTGIWKLICKEIFKEREIKNVKKGENIKVTGTVIQQGMLKFHILPYLLKVKFFYT